MSTTFVVDATSGVVTEPSTSAVVDEIGKDRDRGVADQSETDFETISRWSDSVVEKCDIESISFVGENIGVRCGRVNRSNQVFVSVGLERHRELTGNLVVGALNEWDNVVRVGV